MYFADLNSDNRGDIMSTISLRLSEKEDTLIRKYAELHHLDLSSFIRETVLEKIEEEYDLAVFDDAYDEYKKSGEESRPISDFWKELDI